MVSVMKMAKYKVNYNKDKIDDIEEAVINEIMQANISFDGKKIAIAVGSRGITNIDIIVKTVVMYLKNNGAKPFIVPAMGSHGGATAKGQIDVLKSYNITEEFIGAPIISSMEVVELPNDNLINKVFMDKNAYLADGTIVINRVKAHTDFHDIYESGIIKMCVIGLGKQKQAQQIHSHRIYGLKNLIAPTAEIILKKGNIILGLALVENSYDQTSIIKALKPDEFLTQEPQLLRKSKELMPKLQCDELDILIIDNMGKDISGVGIDTNVIGRMKIPGVNEMDTNPQITTIIVDDITQASHGNALGMGLSDIITKKLYNKIDLHATYQNVITSTFLERGKIPIISNNAKHAFNIAMMTSGPIDIDTAKIMRISDTLHLSRFYASKALEEQLQSNNDVERISEYEDIFTDKELIPF